MTAVGHTHTESADELNDLRAAVRGHLARHVAPLIEKHEQDHTFPWTVVPPLHQFGYVRGTVAEADGGDGMSFSGLAILMEEAGRCWGSLRQILNVMTIVPYVIAQSASAEQKARFLPGLLSGKTRSWLGLTESEAGSDAGGIRMTARRDGDDYILSGTKLYITNGASNDIGILFASTDRDRGARGVTAFLIDLAESPYTAHAMSHLGTHAAVTCELVFDDVRVPAANRIGEEGEGLGFAMRAINLGRLNVAMGAVGTAQAAIEIATEHVTTRHQFGKPLAAFQLVQKLVVDAVTDTEAARLMGMNAAAALDAGRPGRRECSMAKYFCAEASQRAVSNALQACGGAGLMAEMGLERMYRDVREASIPDGTSQIQILTIGRELLGVSAVR